MYKCFFKRVFDFLAAFVGLVVCMPVLLLLAVVLLFANKGNPFFVQMRPGKNEMVFKMIKFKTMNDLTDASGNLLSDEERLTALGSIVRKTSLDEIPQLINVLKGEMSLIGPRPLLIEYLPLYNERQKQRHKVRPGITGWAQVNGRNAISWQQKFEFDVWYVEHVSFKTDFKIVMLSVKKVLLRDGISQEGQATIQAFTGNNDS